MIWRGGKSYGDKDEISRGGGRRRGAFRGSASREVKRIAGQTLRGRAVAGIARYQTVGPQQPQAEFVKFFTSAAEPLP